MIGRAIFSFRSVDLRGSAFSARSASTSSQIRESLKKQRKTINKYNDRQTNGVSTSMGCGCALSVKCNCYTAIAALQFLQCSCCNVCNCCSAIVEVQLLNCYCCTATIALLFLHCYFCSAIVVALLFLHCYYCSAIVVLKLLQCNYCT